MIIYSVTVMINKNVENVWLSWMKGEHVKDMMETNYFKNWEIKKLLLPED